MGHGVDSEPSGWVTDYALMASMSLPAVTADHPHITDERWLFASSSS